MKHMMLMCSLLFLFSALQAQTGEELVRQVRAKLDKVTDYEASGSIKTNVAFIKAPIAKVKVYFKKPNKLRITNESGISFIPKGSMNINLNNLFTGNGFDIIDGGKDSATGWHIVKLLPKDEKADMALSVLYIDEKAMLIRKARTTSQENGTYELQMTYGKYAAYGLADKVIFSFSTKDYKLPKGITFDYDDGSKKEPDADKLKNKTGKVEIVYSSYEINRGVPDSIFK
jgi:outer membrane lipoprotein-sorting protein